VWLQLLAPLSLFLSHIHKSILHTMHLFHVCLSTLLLESGVLSGASQAAAIFKRAEQKHKEALERRLDFHNPFAASGETSIYRIKVLGPKDTKYVSILLGRTPKLIRYRFRW
jgi:hypothetical protein